MAVYACFFFGGLGAVVGVYLCYEAIIFEEQSELATRAIQMLENRNITFENPWEFFLEPTTPPPAYSKFSLDYTIPYFVEEYGHFDRWDRQTRTMEHD